MTLTNTDLDQLDALAEAATPVPGESYVLGGNTAAEDGPAGFVANLPLVPYGRSHGFMPADAALFAKSRAVVLALVAEVRRLRGRE